MRFLLAGAVSLSVLAMPAFALGTGDKMQAWAAASPAEKDALLQKMDASGGASSKASVRSCLDDTAKAPGHSNLSISDIFKACSEQAGKENI